LATIRKRTRKSGDVYIIQVKFTDKGSGEQIVRSTSWKPDKNMTPKQAERAAAVQAELFEQEVRESVSGSKGISDNPNITFREFSMQWLEKVRRDDSLSYYENSKDLLEEINQYIGGYRLREITPAIIQNFFNKLDKKKRTVSQITVKPDFREILQSHGLNYMKLRYDYHIQSCTLANAFAGKGVSKAWSTDLCEKLGIPFDTLFDEKVIETEYAYETIHKYKAVTRSVLSLAKKNRLVADNYATADYIDFPKKPKSKIVCMDDEQARRYYQTLMTFPDLKIRTAMLVFLLTGFRRGEVAGLEWSDIDFERNTISVNRSVTTVKRHGKVEKGTKTEGSERTITASPTLMNALKEYRIWWDVRKESYGDYLAETDKIFTKNNGETIHPSTLYHWNQQILKAAGIEHYSLHSIRHTNITMQIAAGVPIVTVSARAGHARTSTTTDTYAHFIHSSDVVAADTLERVFGNVNGEQSGSPTQSQKPKMKVELVQSFRQAKAEMERLGIETYDEYLDYLEFVSATKNRGQSQGSNDDSEME